MTNAPRPFIRPRRPALLRACAAALALACTTWLAPAAAQTAADYSEISRLIGQRDFKQALSKADAGITANPKDPQLRFLKAVALSESGERTAAIDMLEKLTQDFPELAEPYNNLAVLYAAQGEYDRARLALETAVRNNPKYATALENLGDIYVRMASQRYAQAGQVDRRNRRLAPKQTLLRQALGVGVTTGAAAADNARKATPGKNTAAEKKAAPTTAALRPSARTASAPDAAGTEVAPNQSAAPASNPAERASAAASAPAAP